MKIAHGCFSAVGDNLWPNESFGGAKIIKKCCSNDLRQKEQQAIDIEKFITTNL